MLIKLYPNRIKTAIAMAGLILTAGTANAQVYCTPQAAVSGGNCGQGSPSAIRINSVTTTGAVTNIANANNTCNTSTGYEIYSGPGKELTVNAGTSFGYTIQLASTGTAFPYKVAIWVDWNRDSVFNTLAYPANANGEFMVVSPGAFTCCTVPSGTMGTTIPVPPTAKNGRTRMRIRVGTRNGVNPPYAPPVGEDPCFLGGFYYGEVEDYYVNVINPCSPPSQITYSNLTYNSATIKWKKWPTALMYEYVITTTPGTPGNGNNLTKDTTLNLPDTNFPIVCNTKYYFYIRSICDTVGLEQQNWVVSPWKLDSFVVPPCCYTPEITITNISSTTAIASWTPVPSVQRYEYAVRIDTQIPQSGNITTQTSVVLQGLAPGKEWYFFLRAHCTPTPLSPWGLDSFLTQPGTGIVATGNVKNFEIQAFPNPMKDKFNLRVVGGLKSGIGNIIVTDITGKVVSQLKMENDMMDINLEGKPAGMYLLKYTDDANSTIIKVTKE